MNHTKELIKIAQIHEQRINTAIKRIKHLFPINTKILQNISEDEMVWIEFLINRFGKLQDIIGAKIIDLFLDSKQENIDNISMLDKINKLEKLGIIKNTELWKKMRQVRNHASNEYPDNPSLTCIYLNQLFELTPELLLIFQNITKLL